MSVLASISLKSVFTWLTDLLTAKQQLKAKDKEIAGLRRRIRKLEKSIK